MAQGDEYVKKTSRKSLRVLGSVGEPINPEAWVSRKKTKKNMLFIKLYFLKKKINNQ